MSEDLQQLEPVISQTDQLQEIPDQLVKQELIRLLADKTGLPQETDLDTLLNSFAISPERSSEGLQPTNVLAEFAVADTDRKNELMQQAMEAIENGQASDEQRAIVEVANHVADLVKEQGSSDPTSKKLELLKEDREKYAPKAGYDEEARKALEEIDSEITLLEQSPMELQSEPQKKEESSKAEPTALVSELFVDDFDQRTRNNINKISNEVAEIEKKLNDPGISDSEKQQLESKKFNLEQQAEFFERRAPERTDEENAETQVNIAHESTDDRIDRVIDDINNELADIEKKLSSSEYDDNEKQKLDARKDELGQHLEFMLRRQRTQSDVESPPEQQADNLQPEQESNTGDSTDQEAPEEPEQPITPEEAEALVGPLKFAAFEIGDVSELIREIAEREHYADINSGGLIARSFKKMLKNNVFREGILTRRTEELTELIKGKTPEELFKLADSLDDEASKRAVNSIVMALLSEDQRVMSAEERKMIGTGDEELDQQIRANLKGFIGEYLAIENPSPQDKEAYKERVDEYLRTILSEDDGKFNVIGTGALELLGQVESMQEQLEAVMDHDRAMERVNASLDEMQLIFGNMKAGANGELAHTKFYDTVEKLKSRDTRLGSLLRKHKGLVIGSAVVFGVSAVVGRSLTSTGARLATAGSMGVGAVIIGAYARQQARARAETDHQLSMRQAGTGFRHMEGPDGEQIAFKERFQKYAYETVEYDEVTSELVTEFMEMQVVDGQTSYRLRQNLTDAELVQLCDRIADCDARLAVQESGKGVNLLSTREGQSKHEAKNQLVSIMMLAEQGITGNYSSRTLQVGEQDLSFGQLRSALATQKSTEIADMMTKINTEVEQDTKTQGRIAMVVAPVVGMAAGFALGKAVQWGVSEIAERINPNANNLSQVITTVFSGKRTTVNAPQGTLASTSGGTMSVRLPDGTSFNGLALDSKGGLTPQSLDILRDAGLDAQSVSTTLSTGKSVKIPVSDFIGQNGSKVKLTNWLDMGTPRPVFDGQELGQTYSVRPDGAIVVQQGAGVTFGGGETYSTVAEARGGSLALLFRDGGKAIVRPMRLSPDGVPTRVIQPDSPLYSMFKVSGDSVTPKSEFLHVGVMHGEHKFSSVSTVLGLGKGSVDGVEHITREVSEITLRNPATEAPQWYSPLFPILPERNQAERVKDGEEQAPTPTPTPTPTPQPIPVVPPVAPVGPDETGPNPVTPTPVVPSPPPVPPVRPTTPGPVVPPPVEPTSPEPIISMDAAGLTYEKVEDINENSFINVVVGNTTEALPKPGWYRGKTENGMVVIDAEDGTRQEIPSQEFEKLVTSGRINGVKSQTSNPLVNTQENEAVATVESTNEQASQDSGKYELGPGERAVKASNGFTVVIDSNGSANRVYDQQDQQIEGIGPAVPNFEDVKDGDEFIYIDSSGPKLIRVKNKSEGALGFDVLDANGGTILRESDSNPQAWLRNDFMYKLRQRQIIKT